MSYVNKEVVPYKTDFREPPSFNQKNFQDLLLESIAQGASDTFLQSGAPVAAVINGNLLPLTKRRLNAQEVMQILEWVTDQPSASNAIANGDEVVGSAVVLHPTRKDSRGDPERCRFRVNGSRIDFRSGVGVQVVMRSIPSSVPSIDGMGLDQEIIDAITPKDGIVYVTGATGSGKTTTLASVLRYIGEGDTPIKGHIMTIESPIEFDLSTIDSTHSLFSQSEVGRDTRSFSSGVRSAMRRYPALILIGEIRDWETASAAMEAAQTGHPSFATVHTTSVDMIFARILSRCPIELQHSALFDLITTSRLLINQTLAKTIDGKRTPLREYLVITPQIQEELLDVSDPSRITAAVRNILQREGKTMARAATEAFEKGLISERELAKHVKSGKGGRANG